MPRQTTLLFVVIAALFFVSERELAFCGVCCERDVLSKNGLDFLDFRVSIFLHTQKALLLYFQFSALPSSVSSSESSSSS